MPRPIRPELVWTEDVVQKIGSRHAVAIEEVQEAFEDPQALITRGRWETKLVYGRSESGRYLLKVTRPEGRRFSGSSPQGTWRQMRKGVISRNKAKPQKKPTPPSGNRVEAAEFWETHDSTQFFSHEDLVPLRTWTKGRRVRHIYVTANGSQFEMIPLRKRSRKRISA